MREYTVKNIPLISLITELENCWHTSDKELPTLQFIFFNEYYNLTILRPPNKLFIDKEYSPPSTSFFIAQN